MKKGLSLVLLALPLLFSRCGVNKQISQAKALGDCRYTIGSADSVYLAGVDVRQFRKIEDINPARYPRLATGLLTRNVPLEARINLDIVNPTNKLAGINQLEYRILLAGQELFTDPKTRDAFTQLVQNFSGATDAQPSKLTIRIKPTLDLGGKQVNYPGYITINQDVTNKILLGQ